MARGTDHAAIKREDMAVTAVSTALDGAPPAARKPGGPHAYLRWLLPLLVFAALIGFWEYAVYAGLTTPVIVSAPSRIFTTFFTDWNTLGRALASTLITTCEGFALAVLGGAALAIVFSQSRLVEYALYPYAVILQVTPILSIAPLLLIIMSQSAAVLVCAWLVAFFPVLSNTLIGLRSTDHNLLNLFELYGASGWQKLWHLKLRGALPYFLGGLRIAGGLSLIGAVVAELAAGTGGANSGLGVVVLIAPRMSKFPLMYAALVLLSLVGIVIFLLLSLVSHLMLRKWHESALKREN
jgi:NitT/TauT family transport system permease protein